MPPNPTPYIVPTTLEFYLDQPSRTEAFCLYNPFPHDILFKVDNANPDKFYISLTQGLVSSHQKITLQLTCTCREASQEEGVQVRFFKWGRSRQGQKPRPQQYVGFRTISINVYNDRSENIGDMDRAVSEPGTSLGRSGSSHGGGVKGANPAGSGRGDNLRRASGSSGRGSIIDREQVDQRRGRGESAAEKRLHVIINLIFAVALCLCGFALNKMTEEWFAAHVIEGFHPHTLSVVSYTLAIVVMIKLLTFR